MEEDVRRSDDKEPTLNFAILISKKTTPKGLRYRIEAQNQGILDAEVILILEAWLDKVKAKFKDDMTSGMFFQQPPSDKDT